jgi:hypothetical protein
MKQAKAAEKTTNAGKTEVIPYDKVPKLFMEETGYKLADYSVGLGYYPDENTPRRLELMAAECTAFADLQPGLYAKSAQSGADIEILLLRGLQASREPLR